MAARWVEWTPLSASPGSLNIGEMHLKELFVIHVISGTDAAKTGGKHKSG